MGKSSFMGKKVEFFNRIILYMRTYLLIRLHFMLIITYMDLFNQIYVINYTKFEHIWPKCPVYGEKSSFMGKKVEFFNRIIFYMRTYLHLCLQFMLINIYMDLFNQIYVINYTKFEQFCQNVQFMGKKTSFMGKKVQFFNCTVFYMRTYLLLRLQFMLINTYMDLFNQMYVINYTKFNIFGQNVQFMGESPVLWLKTSSFLIV